MRKIYVVITSVAIALAACTDEPLVTEAQETESFQGESLAKGGALVIKNQVIWEETDYVDGPYYLSCLDEDATFTIDWRWTSSIVVTPSGNENWNGWLEEWSNEFTSSSTGHQWIGEGIAHISEHYKSNGSYRGVEPIHETFVNQTTGEKLKLLWIWKATPEVPFSFELISCTVIGS